MEKYALVTGASSGIGETFCHKLHDNGYHLILVARRKERLEKLKENLKDDQTVIIDGDLNDESFLKYLTSELDKYDIEVAINNAGYGLVGDFVTSDLDTELKMCDLNIKAMHYLTKYFVRRFKEKDEGKILNVASIAGLMKAGPYMSTYYATKAYVVSLTRAIQEELRQANSHVYLGVLCPGPVDTEFNDVANCKFSLKGISATKCVNYTYKKMLKKKKVIIPSFQIRAVNFFSHLVPTGIVIRITSHQQKKKYENK